MNEYPNIIYILADDLGYGDLSCLNWGSKIPTPHMDRLAREGMQFSDAHASSAVCTPSRYSILTGRYAWRTRLKEWVLIGHSPSLIEPGRLTVASFLRDRGYATGCVGKWHLGLDWQKKQADKPLAHGSWLKETENVDYGKDIFGGPEDHGFEYAHYIAASLDMAPYCYIENRRALNMEKASRIAENAGSGSDAIDYMWREGDIAAGFDHSRTAEHFGDKAMAFIERCAADEEQRPFFLYYPLTAPHTPILPDERFAGSSEAGPYGDFVAQTDHEVGRILQVLDERGLAENTLVIVTSDNGSRWAEKAFIDQYDHKPNHIYRGMKSDIWDGGHRVPLLARWPRKISAGQASDRLVCLTDLLATCADIVDTPLPHNAGEDSYSHYGALVGEPEKGPEREHAVHHSGHGMFAIRDGKWKLILGKGSGGWSSAGQESDPPGQLYDMENDVEETTNLYEEHPDIVERLSRLLDMGKQEERSR